MLKLLFILLIVYISVCVLLYFVQERMIFFPHKISKDHPFRFEGNFEEMIFTMPDNADMHGILFKADSSKGMIFYLHGNAGSIESWGDVAPIYTSLGYDLFMLDYRGYGKSDGSISSEQQFHNDVKFIYQQLTSRYNEASIVILGYSIGTGAAAKLASESNARLLILQSPFYSLTSVMKAHYAIIPGFILRYKFETYKYLPACRMPIVIFHGEDDTLIHPRNSEQLKSFFKPSDTLILLKGVGHNGMSHDPEYLNRIGTILN